MTTLEAQLLILYHFKRISEELFQSNNYRIAEYLWTTVVSHTSLHTVLLHSIEK